MAKPYAVLFLCTGNSARSILAEALLRHIDSTRFRAYSAGSRPVGTVHPRALDLLTRLRIATDELRSKSWDEFAGPTAPELDFVFTVCDAAAGEQCPVWPGAPVTAHWGVADPASASGTEIDRANAFREAFRVLERRISLFVSLPIGSLDRLTLNAQLRQIGST